jgi:hypothetical protein
MRTCRTNLACLALVVLAGAPLAHAQQPPARDSAARKEKPKEAAPADRTALEDLLAQALKYNPDIRVAEARVQKAEAELNRTRLQVMQQVAAFDAARKVARGKVAQAEQEYERARRLTASAGISAADLRATEQALIVARGELETVEAQMPSLLGKSSQRAQGEKPDLFEHSLRMDGKLLSGMQLEQDTARALAALAAAQAARTQDLVPDQVRKALETPISLEVKDMPLSDVLEAIAGKTHVMIRNPLLPRWKEVNPKITLKLPEALPVRAVLQILEDEMPEDPALGPMRFVVRGYGLLVVAGDRIPPGALLVDQLLPTSPAGTNPPAADVEGQVKAVDEKSGLVTITIGSDAGLAKGNTLEVFRLQPAPKYLGTIRVIEVTPHEAVAQPMSRLAAPLQPGDRAASKLQGSGK